MDNVPKVYGPDWRRTQLSTIGASNAAAVVGKSRWKRKGDYWQALHDVIVDGKEPPALPESDDMRRGRRFEGTARDMLSEYLSEVVQPHPQGWFLRNEAYPWAHCLPDGFRPDGTPVELKVPRPGTIAKCNMNGLIPEWALQLQHTMAVTDTREIVFAMLDPVFCFVHVQVIERDDEVVRWLMAAEHDFFSSILLGVRPDDSAADTTDIEPVPSGTIVLASDEARDTVAALIRMRSLVSDAEEVVEQLKDRLKEMSQGAECFEVPGVARCYNRTNKPGRTLDKKLALEDFADLALDKYWKTSKPSQQFRVYDLRERGTGIVQA